MDIVKIDQANCSDAVVQQIVDVLRDGGVVLHPTETCYGLTCDALNADGVRKLYEVKQMPFEKPVSVLVGSREMAGDYGVIEGVALELSERWPEAFTMIVRRTEMLPGFLNPGIETVGMRWSVNPLCQKIISSLGNPITTTSANLSGQKEVYAIDDFIAQLNGGPEPDMILDAGTIPQNLPSTLVDCTHGDLKILRQGEFSL